VRRELAHDIYRSRQVVGLNLRRKENAPERENKDEHSAPDIVLVLDIVAKETEAHPKMWLR
jgi:hypothetical protein